MHVVIISSKYPIPSLEAGADGNNEALRTAWEFSQGGVATHVWRLSQALARRGHEVTVFAYAPACERVAYDGNVRVCWLSPSDEHAGLDPLAALTLKSLEQRFFSRAQELLFAAGRRPDVIHCHHSGGFQAARALGEMMRAPVVSSLHFLLFSRHKVDIGEFPESMRDAERAMCHGSDHLIAVSRWMKESALETVGVAPTKITVIHNGFRPEVLRLSREHLNQLRGQYAGPEQKIVVYAGRIGRDKGVPPLLDSARLVLQQAVPLVYVIAGGSGDELKLMREKIESCETLRGRVHCTGWLTQQELRRLYAIADLAVVPSIYEPFGFAALEAMAASVPVIASDAGGLPEIVQHDRSGWIVPLNDSSGRAEVDVQSLADAQLRILSDPELGRRLACAGSKRAKKRFAIGQMAKKTLEVYCRACQQLANAHTQKAAG
jgi:glycosyltransferase involved in cell wall biosynthesis